MLGTHSHDMSLLFFVSKTCSKVNLKVVYYALKYMRIEKYINLS